MREASAGGVVYHRKPDQSIEIQLIQDRYDRITLAKGKMEPGETEEQTALREIEEETGIKGRIIETIKTIHYQYMLPKKGMVDKEVHYFLVERISGELTPQLEEIQHVFWCSPQEAWQQQLNAGYDNNDEVLQLALQKLGIEVSLEK